MISTRVKTGWAEAMPGHPPLTEEQETEAVAALNRATESFWRELEASLRATVADHRPRPIRRREAREARKAAKRVRRRAGVVGEPEPRRAPRHPGDAREEVE